MNTFSLPIKRKKCLEELKGVGGPSTKWPKRVKLSQYGPGGKSEQEGGNNDEIEGEKQ